MASPELNRRVKQLRHDVDDIYELLDRTHNSVAVIERTVADHTAQLHRLEQAQVRMGERLDRIERNQQAQERILQSQGELLERLGERLDRQDERLGRQDQRLSRQDELLERQDERL